MYKLLSLIMIIWKKAPTVVWRECLPGDDTNFSGDDVDAGGWVPKGTEKGRHQPGAAGQTFPLVGI
jgi:hypothetical protein